MIDIIPCVRCKSTDSTDTDINADYNGSAKLRMLITVSSDECDEERTYANSFSYIRN